ncbi:tyrosine-protein phosphatase non-receptor type 61F isoform X3 [Phlebotomus papatasi]|uniref:tyrosine-protein phosphatase non-receptor type 61F isoform X3 n=1 Tax=Phlebotomus papatasi TaxID=29031 RepID=UPI00248434A2|nr:tyrosine-protein phosphatase non-receptor type 61F isoform X3 [Phlebotomus papatasi]
MTSTSIEAEYGEINDNNRWHGVFQSIKDKCELEAKQKQFTLDESKSVSNRKYNRYRDVNPYDHSRIVLHRGDTDYINANLVKMERANRKYILTQGPLQQTVSHFWLMVWEQDSKAILMLNKLLENKQVKCHLYWPEKIGEEHRMNLTDVGLTVEYLQMEDFGNFSIRTLRLTDTESTKSREILQFHYTTWPDFGIPSSPVAFLQFLKKVRKSGALDDDVGPPVVHCSAGIGRSGTFCLVDCCLVLIEREGENKVSVQDVLLELRRFRMGLIQTVDQLLFSYQAIIEGIKRLNNPLSQDFDDYYEKVTNAQSEEDENVDQAPPPLPPPRVDSLHGGQPAKPLPSIPTGDAEGNPVAVNGNDEPRGEENGVGSVDRPLPPLPRDNSLEKVDESQSDHDSLEDEEEDDLAEDEAEEEGSEEMNEAEKNGLDNSNDSIKSDENIDNSQEEAQLRRRKRQERQDAMAEKVREIKRKQKMSEESSPKKRRTHCRSQSKSERGKL